MPWRARPLPAKTPTRQHSILLAHHLEATLPFRLMATLTAPRLRSPHGFDTCFSEWIQSVQRNERTTIGYIRADELRPMRHIHAILVAARPLSAEIACTTWQELVGNRSRDAALITAYRNGGGGGAYVIKMIEEDGEVRFSPNLALFAPTGLFDMGKMSPVERRQCRRIAQQIR